MELLTETEKEIDRSRLQDLSNEQIVDELIIRSIRKERYRAISEAERFVTVANISERLGKAGERLTLCREELLRRLT